jgi:hydroxylamine dehydrogenase
MSKHAQKGVYCLDCHQAASGQEKKDHHSFVISAGHLTAGNCRGCHEDIYQQFLRSRHAATSWAAIYGKRDLLLSR